MGSGIYSSAPQVDEKTITGLSGTLSIKGGCMLLVETKLLSANATTFDFSTAIDSDIDEEYLIIFNIINNSLNSYYHLRVNGGAITTSNVQESYFSNTTHTLLRHASARIAGAYNVGDLTAGVINIFAKNGIYKSYISNNTVRVAGGTNTTAWQFFGFMTDPDANTKLISLGISNTGADGIGAGSSISLYKKVKQ